MSSVNAATKPAPIFTHEGVRAERITPLQELIRLSMACMLWEDGFYESGKSVADRIRGLVNKVTLAEASAVAIEARNNMKLRHVPLLIVREMARHPKRHANVNHLLASDGLDYNHTSWISRTLAEVIQRPDELTEFLAIYWKDGKCPLSKQVKLGLAKAFQKFNEYSLAKYNRKKGIMLRDVLFLCHSKPADAADGKWNKDQRNAYAALKRVNGEADSFLKLLRPDGFSAGELLYGKLVYDQLATPDTWEVELSANGNNVESWLRLLREQKLGDLAFLRNLRNMVQVGVRDAEIVISGEERRWGRVLPFRFIAAARMVPQLEPHLERWMFKCLEGADKLPGRTILLVDTSGSMREKLSAKSDLTRSAAAQALAMLLREVCEELRVVCFDSEGREVPPRRGFALADLCKARNAGTDLGGAVAWANSQPHDRLIVLTDEQSATRVPAPNAVRPYMINVASNRNGVGYGQWLHIDGFSEAVVSYIQRYEGK